MEAEEAEADAVIAEAGEMVQVARVEESRVSSASPMPLPPTRAAVVATMTASIPSVVTIGVGAATGTQRPREVRRFQLITTVFVWLVFTASGIEREQQVPETRSS